MIETFEEWVNHVRDLQSQIDRTPVAFLTVDASEIVCDLNLEIVERNTPA